MGVDRKWSNYRKREPRKGAGVDSPLALEMTLAPFLVSAEKEPEFDYRSPVEFEAQIQGRIPGIVPVVAEGLGGGEKMIAVAQQARDAV